ncbi:hypothetical protein GOV14_02905 [Candidatus Pacearchaeota archaeon]|nr:hypothetical protein [Candidatus Pacearchaeota archaeon]
MGVNLSLKAAVVIVLAMAFLIGGVVLIVKVSMSVGVIPGYPVPVEKIKVEVTPGDSLQGTQFLVRAYWEKQRPEQDLSLMIQGPETIERFFLYDDGEHYDLELKDYVYAAHYDSKGHVDGVYNIKNDKETLASFRIGEPKCDLIVGNSNDNNINFVILPYGYNDFDAFVNDAKKIVAGRGALLSKNPFKSNRDKFSFSVVNTNVDLECEVGCNDVSTLVCCNTQKVKKEAMNCHHDSIFVLLNNSQLCGSASSYAKICAKNENSQLILMHELGHSFADLADEYVYSNYFGDYDVGKIDKANCDTETCSKWQQITTGCYPGCTYDSLYRSVEDQSVMFDLYPEYNAVSRDKIIRLVNDYTQKENEAESLLPDKKSYVVSMRYHNGEIDAGDVFLMPVKSGFSYKSSKYNYSIKDDSGNIIYSSNLEVPNKVYPVTGPDSVPVSLASVEFLVMVPYARNGDVIEIRKENEIVDTVSVTAFSNKCGDNVCDDDENYLSCSKDCSLIGDHFCQTDVCDTDCPDIKSCSKRARDYLLPVILVAISLIVIVILIIRNKKKKR